MSKYSSPLIIWTLIIRTLDYQNSSKATFIMNIIMIYKMADLLYALWQELTGCYLLLLV